MQCNQVRICLAKGIYAVARALQSGHSTTAQAPGAPIRQAASNNHQVPSNLAPLVGAAVRDLKPAKQAPPVPPPTWIAVVAARALREAPQLSAAPDTNFSSRLQGPVEATGKPPIFPRSSALPGAKPPIAPKVRHASSRPPIPPRPFITSDHRVGHAHHHRVQHLPVALQNRAINRAAPSLSMAQNLLPPHRGDIKGRLNHSFVPNDPVQRPVQNYVQPIQFPSVDRIASFIQKSGLWNSSEGDFAIEWIASHPTLTDGRPLHMWQGNTFSKLAPASDILDNRPIHIVRTAAKDAAGVESAHYSAAKLIDGQLHVFNTAGDGDCFFRSVLAGVAGIAPEQVAKSDIQKMRSWAAVSILANKAEIEKRFSEILG